MHTTDQYVEGNTAVLPPSVIWLVPFMYAPALPTINKTNPAISFTLPILPYGI